MGRLGDIFTAALLVLASAQISIADSIDGAWTPVYDWPLIAIHAALTPDGRVLTYGTDGTGKQTGFFVYDIWDPAAGLESGHRTLDNMTQTDIFCSSQIILPQSGEILIAGGDNWTGTNTTNTGNNNSNLFDSGGETLTRSSNMNRARWYSSATALVNGEIYIQGGSGGAGNPEVRQLNGAFRFLTSASTSGLAVLFPRNFLAPDGRVFGYDTSGRMYYVDPSGTGSITLAGQIPSANVGWTSSAAMFAPGKILQIGGNSNGAIVIDINGPQPVITPTQSMSTKRKWVGATVLPDGQVLATGGSEVENQLVGVNNSAEIWDPTTGEWHVGASAEKARLYHNSALLLPDATVLVAGGGAPGPLSNTNAEIYYPPYLFDLSGNLAPRPEILSVADTVNVGDTLSIEVNTPDISRVTLVKSGSVTHSVNMDQRFVELAFTASANLLQATLPLRASETPPGFYQMFVINGAGVPSLSKMLRINIDPTPDTSVDYTPLIGGSGGTPFTLACNADEILVGVHGRYETNVNQIGPRCVAMDQLGRWIGTPVSRPVTGGTAAGTAFSKTCPTNFAVSGFRGRAGQYVNQIEIECRALTPDGTLTGDGQFLGADGSSGGSAQSLFRCGTGNPVYALYGRSGNWVDSFGAQCRQGEITPISINSEPVIVNPGAQSAVAGLAVDLQLNASDSDNDPLSFSATGLPPGMSLNTSTGYISGTPAVVGGYSVTVTVSDGIDFDSATFAWDITATAPLAVETMAAPPPAEIDTLVTYTAVAQGGLDPVFKWSFGDGTPETAWSTSASVNHEFAEAGVFYVTLTVTDSFGVPDIQTFAQTVHLPLTATQPMQSQRIAYENGATGRIWVVNQDNDSVSVFDAQTHSKLAEIPVGLAPRSIAIGPFGRAWVSNEKSASISIIDSAALSVVQTVSMPSESQPYGLVFSPVAPEAYVVLAATAQLLKLDATNGAQLTAVSVGAEPRHVSISADGASVYVSRFVTPKQPGEDTAAVQSEINGAKTGGEVRVIDRLTMTVTDTIILQHSTKPDGENQGGGVPNYLAGLAISPDGTNGWVPSKQDNVARGTLRSGSNLNFQNTVRAISSRIDLQSQTEMYANRIDLDNASVASAAAFDPLGVYLFVALETSREVAVVDVHGNTELFRIGAGRAPQALTVSPDGLRLYVGNFMDRTVDVFDLTELRINGMLNVDRIATLQSVGNEKLDPEVLAGKKLFYDARDTRLARDRYMSCASCHNEGGQDGRVWDLTGMGEGLRNTINLKGAGPDGGFLHWSQNFDEIQDFEGQIRSLAGGIGLMSDADFSNGTRGQPLGDPKAGLSADLDALAAYVASLQDEVGSPLRLSNGSLTASAEAGREIFRRENCASCHGGVGFSDSGSNALHDIGTIKPTSGQRLNGPLTGIDTPTLRGVWRTAPYLHDGSAATLTEAIGAHNFVSLDAADLSSLNAYVGQVDINEVAAPASNVPPSVTNPGAQSHEQGTSVNLAIVATDANGDVLGYAATGLPASLAIHPLTGLISGQLSAEGNYNVVVMVNDGADTSSVNFSWQVLAAPPPPPPPPPPPASAEVLMVVGKVPLTSQDTVALNRLQSLGHTVTVVRDTVSSAADASGKHLVVISESVGSGNVADKFAQVAVPVVAYEPWLYDDMGLTGLDQFVDYGSQGNQTQLQMSGTHPLTGGLSGTVTVGSSGSTFSWGKPGASAIVAATLNGDPSRAAIFAYETGALQANSVPAPARRVALHPNDNTMTRWSANGQLLFDAAIQWALTGGAATNQPPNVNAGPDTSVTVGVPLVLSGTVTDDGLELPVTTSWTPVAGASFSNINDPGSSVTFSGAGVFVLQLAASDPEFTVSDTVTVTVTAAPPPPPPPPPPPASAEVLMVVGKVPLTSQDTVALNRLQSLGHTVTVVRDTVSSAADASGKHLVVISESVGSGNVADKFAQVAVPVVAYEPWLYDDMGLTGLDQFVDYGSQGNQTQLQMSGTHPLTGGLSGTVTVGSSGSTFSWGKPGASAIVAATLNGDPSRAAIFAYETGALQANSVPAPARRVALHPNDNTMTRWSANGQLLFDAAIQWALGDVVSVPRTRIMPLGDSITEGVDGYWSFRRDLAGLLSGEACAYDMVGSQNGPASGSPGPGLFDRDHEGHRGFRTDEILSGLPGWLPGNVPDWALIHVGTNDVLQGRSTSVAGANIGSIIDLLRSVKPDVGILLARIIPNRPQNDDAVADLNSEIVTLAAAKDSATSPVIVVDQYTGYDTAVHNYDQVHPNESGEALIANRWFQALSPRISDYCGTP